MYYFQNLWVQNPIPIFDPIYVETVIILVSVDWLIDKVNLGFVHDFKSTQSIISIIKK